MNNKLGDSKVKKDTMNHPVEQKMLELGVERQLIANYRYRHQIPAKVIVMLMGGGLTLDKINEYLKYVRLTATKRSRSKG